MAAGLVFAFGLLSTVSAHPEQGREALRSTNVSQGTGLEELENALQPASKLEEGEKVHFVREQLGMILERFGVVLGEAGYKDGSAVPQQTLHQWETGRVSVPPEALGLLGQILRDHSSSAGLEEGAVVEQVTEESPQAAADRAQELTRFWRQSLVGGDYNEAVETTVFSGFPAGESVMRAVLQGYYPGTVIVARRNGEMAGFSYGTVSEGKGTISRVAVDPGNRQRGLGTRLFQQALWSLVGQHGGVVSRVGFYDASDEGVTDRIGRRFFFKRTLAAGNQKDFEKEILPGAVALEEERAFTPGEFIGSVLWQEYWKSFDAEHDSAEVSRERDRVLGFLWRDGAEVIPARVDLSMIPVYAQGDHLYGLVREHLRAMLPGVLFYPRRLPASEEEAAGFTWSDLGLVLENEMLGSPALNPRGLPLRRVSPTPEAVRALDPLALLAAIFRDRLGVPPDHQVEALLFTDAEGNARLVLLHSA